ncbi:hypothetical protein NK8_35100 [Caballeronia sp. NK8]|uniref:hypothetical protein n=1 Tax=Caballeronia sp. NK8 TaxID=140098 RepID=UPI001BB51741|nr:hypothetical protein [Caballeronia sp. NK8]BCQ25333.1 hypothetical protein NK8_35100 [Caballeronia sp. NK8]
MIVISLLFDRAPAALINHRHYAREHAYRHVEIDLSDLSGSSNEIRWVYKYETLLRQLEQAQSNEIVMLLSENAAILRSMPLPDLMAGRDWLLTCSDSDLPQTDVLMFRNTQTVREKVADLVSRCRFGVVLPEREGELLHAFDACPQQHRIGDAYVVIPAATNLESVWASWQVFSISIRDEKQHRRFRTALVEHINECQVRRLPYLTLTDTGVRETETHNVYQPHRPIAIVTLYTPNITRYGRIAEANLRRYCERQGYTLYVHRDIPARLNDGKTAGNWFKAALLREYLPNHQWVFWLDADVLINDMNQRLEPFTHGRETVLARDMGTWDFNSGIMGFQCNQQNYDAFARVIDECAKLEDKSNVYASRGDQHYFIRAFEERPDLKVSSFIDINTPWIYRRPDSFMVHYVGMWQDNRALLMDYDLRQSAME